MTAEGTRLNPVPAAAVSLVHHAPSVVTYAVLTVLLTWPLVTAPGAWAPHDAGDPLLSTWALWWM